MPDTPAPAQTFEFWLGRAGAGKTHRCVEEIAAELRERPRGAPLLLLVPEQASAQMEYRIATVSGVAGFTRARVLSFRLLQREAFARVGGSPQGLIDEPTRVMLLRRIMRRRAGELQTLGSSADLPGTAESISANLLELQRYGWRLDDLDASLRSIEPDRSEYLLLCQKLEDLRLIWSDYASLLSARGMQDLPEMAAAAAKSVREWRELEGARVWIDGFATFTAEEQMLLEALLGHATHASMTLLLDPAVQGQRRQGIFENVVREKERLANRFRELGWFVREISLPVDDGNSTRFSSSPALAHLERQLTRPVSHQFSDYPDLVGRGPGDGWPYACVELVEAPHRRAEVEAVARRIAACCGGEPDGATPAAFTPGRVAWSDVTVVVRDMETYAPLVREIFPRYGVPFFLDRRRSISAHPLARLLLSALDIMRHGLRTELVLDYLKTGLTPLTNPDDVARVERLAQQRRLRREDWPDVERWIGASREDTPQHRHADRQTRLLFSRWQTAMQPLADLHRRLAAPDADPARDLWQFIDRLKCGPRLTDWIDAARRDGDLETASIHAEAWAQCLDLLDRLHAIRDVLNPTAGGNQSRSTPVAKESKGQRRKSSSAASLQPDLFAEHSIAEQTATGANDASPASAQQTESGARNGSASSGSLDLDELYEIVETGLATVRAALIPPALEQVLVGSVERSRTPPVKAAFVLGLNDGEFPRVYDPDPILNDQDRERMASGRRRLGPDSNEKFVQERFLAYVALTRASHLLVLSRPRIDERGAAASPSAFFRLVLDALPGAPHVQLPEKDWLDDGGLPCLPERWARSILQAYHRAAGAEDPSALGAALASGHPLSSPALTRAREGADRDAAIERVCRAFAALRWPRPAHLDPDLAREYWQSRKSLSVTALETYATCPYRFFAERMLRLEQPPPPTPGARELGILRHHVLQMLFETFRRDGRLNWATLDLHAAEEVIERAAHEAAERALEDHFGRDELTAAIVEATISELKVFAKALKRMGERYGFDQIAAEFRLRDAGDSFAIPTAAGPSLTLDGKVDRIDVLRRDGNGENSPPVLALYDFKSGGRALKAGRLIDGLDIQLAVYALALRDGAVKALAEAVGERANHADIAGMFYWSLNVAFEKAEGDKRPDPGDEEWFKPRRIRGLFDASYVPHLDGQVQPGDGSVCFGFKLKKDGNLNASMFGGLSSRDFERYLGHVQGVIERSVGQIVEGRVELRPLSEGGRLGCEYCDCGSVCRATTFSQLPVNLVSRVKNSEFAGKLQPGPTRV